MKIVISTDSAQPNQRYRGALLCAGALPEEVVLVTPSDPVPTDFDGLLVAGGADVDPSRYGETAATPTLELNAERDTLDLTLFAASQRRNVPVFGICRGMQLLNVALGGTLWQDLASQRDRGLGHEYDRSDYAPDHPAHPVKTRVSRGDASPVAAALAEADDELLNSRHHQAVKDLAAGLRPLAASPDDLVEAFERPGGSYLAAVQWHPEDLVARPSQKKLFRTFLDACRSRAAQNGLEGAPLVEVALEGAIPVVKLNRPAKRNAFAGGMRELLAGTVEALGGDPTVPVIILTGAGKAFSAGGDLEVMRALAEVRDVDGFRELLEAGARAILATVRAPRPVLAAIDGPAVGAGMSLALACDVRVASAFGENEAVFSQSFTAVGLSPDWGSSFHLPLLIGPSAAADLVFSADRIGARRALEIGLVDALAEDGPSLPAALMRAERYAERSTAALAAAKKNLNADRLPRLIDALARETEAQIGLFRSGDVLRHLPVPEPRRSDRQEIS
jgi:enoyl-CoA hydratase/carnithine racemase/gamma-glutamyl-gamma-aminobutyrate hydrolase PuuD